MEVVEKADTKVFLLRDHHISHEIMAKILRYVF